MNWLSQDWVWNPLASGASRWLSHLKRQAWQPCPIRVRTDVGQRERGELARVGPFSNRFRGRR